jgi:5-methylcytosine-specific restriction endonuclease McrA
MLDIWLWPQADHIVPVSGGGGECDLSNYQTLCASCHEMKTNDDRVNVKLQKAAEGVSDIRGFMTQRDT